jgi:hypothetical protein
LRVSTRAYLLSSNRLKIVDQQAKSVLERRGLSIRDVDNFSKTLKSWQMKWNVFVNRMSEGNAANLSYAQRWRKLRRRSNRLPRKYHPASEVRENGRLSNQGNFNFFSTAFCFSRFRPVC